MSGDVKFVNAWKQEQKTRKTFRKNGQAHEQNVLRKSLKKHLLGTPLKKAIDLSQRENLTIEKYAK